MEHVIKNGLIRDDIVVYTRMGTSSTFVGGQITHMAPHMATPQYESRNKITIREKYVFLSKIWVPFDIDNV